MDAITVKHVRKSFGNHSVLKDMNLAVKRGEIFTLLGENGSGKSTLINILTTISLADDGEVQIMGHPIMSDAGLIRENISLNSQTVTLDDEFTGYQNLLIIAELRLLKNAKTEIKQISERLNLTSFLNKKVGKYSGGMKRRLDIAMSLLGNPEIIFLDEPTTGVDPKNRVELWNIIKEIRDSGKTVFLTTQYLDEADKLSDHMGFLNDGKIVLYGTPDEIKKNARRFVQINVDSPNVNLVNLPEEMIISKNNKGTSFVVDERNTDICIKILVNENVSIHSVVPQENSLEEVFFNVTKIDSEGN
ncbi:ABC transporter ATP-binding protein [Companilactobacillus insicii]|uniref:ABC transporter ATP-binding protein n=1 Tax=Companilactobacillus insicii TaxID=1732567 RepID=UPI000F77A5F2|nr:ABC transporter ATP-binding protein [Companilactobacillus insicii]